MNFNELRKQHSQFIYEGFETKLDKEDLKVTFNFLLTPDTRFRPEVIFPNVSLERLDKIGLRVLENLVFNLGIVELISYWKAACPPQIVINAGFLNEEQVKYWKELLIKGLGEFFYTNKIDFTRKDLVQFVILSKAKDINKLDSEQIVQNGKKKLKDEQVLSFRDRDLVLVGGGKDSAVTLDIISKSEKEYGVLLLNPTLAAKEIAFKSGCQKIITITRRIDPKLLELNKSGYLNGHTPFSAYLAFLGSLAGVFYDYKNIVVSNESSSNESNVIWMGQEINHQYSKSFEFEKDFRQYCQKYLAPINYYSYIRSLNELEISELFSKMPQYHKLFRSCNKGSKQGIWCGRCPKCVSTYLTLYPYLGSKLKEIFGKDLLRDESLIPLVKGLLRENDVVKPFECVATVEEIKTAISLGIERAKKDGSEIPKVLQATYETTRS